MLNSRAYCETAIHAVCPSNGEIDAIVTLAPIVGRRYDNLGAVEVPGEPMPGLYYRNGGRLSAYYEAISAEDAEALLAAGERRLTTRITPHGVAHAPIIGPAGWIIEHGKPAWERAAAVPAQV